MKKSRKKPFKIILLILLIVLILAGGLLGWLSAAEYRPKDTEKIAVVSDGDAKAAEGDTYNIVSWNIGYCGLGADASFVLDGGKDNGTPDSEGVFLSYYTGIRDTLAEFDADIYLLQEADSDSARSYHLNEVTTLQSGLNAAQSAYALNYSCPFVPFPWPPIGKVNSGILTLTDYKIESSERISLPCPFSWPLRIANLKRCLLVCRIPLEDSDKELVIVNLHMEAYDDGEGKAAQTAMLYEILQKEYAAGNYVIAGGDFNQAFPDSLDAYPIKNDELWTPGALDAADLPEGWSFAYDQSTPSCRLLNQPLDPDDPATQYYVIDGFIVSPNVRLLSVKTVDCGFAYSDHNPVSLSIKLLQQ